MSPYQLKVYRYSLKDGWQWKDITEVGTIQLTTGQVEELNRILRELDYKFFPKEWEPF